MPPKLTVLTYGSGHPRYVKGRQLTAFSARLYGADEVIECDSTCIDPEFKARNHEILSHPRGGGYWLWKSYVINRAMDQMADGEVLFYVDGDQIFVTDFKEAALSALQVQPLIFRGLPDPWCDAFWTKGDLLRTLNLIERPDLIYKGQHEAGRQIILVNEFTRIIARKWLEFCCVPHFINDAPSETPNLEGFQEHRHDQSIFSAITKIAGLRTFEWTEEFWKAIVAIRVGG